MTARAFPDIRYRPTFFATSSRVKLDHFRHFKSYTRELSGKAVKPVPPVLFSVTASSADHTVEKYQNIVLPMFAAMTPAPKVRFVPFRAGVHSYTRQEPGLPLGVAPAVAQLWYDAIMGGYFHAP